MKTFNICFASDDNFTKYLATAMASVIYNSKDDEHIIFHVISDNGKKGISEESKNKLLRLKKIKDCEIIFYVLEYAKYANWFDKYLHFTRYNISPVMFYRLSIPSLISNVDKILYLDSDIVVNKSLSDLFDMPIDGFYALVTEDLGIVREYKTHIGMSVSDLYFNSGVMMLNNKICIENNVEKQYEECFFNNDNYKRLMFQDQDVLNLVFRNKVRIIEHKYNFFAVNKGNIDDIVVLHYTGPGRITKPDNEYCPNMNYLDLFWKYFYLTPWFDGDFEKYNRIIEKQKSSDEVYQKNLPRNKMFNHILYSISWWIPNRKWRSIFRKKFQRE